MIVGIDHVVILVGDLQAASRDYKKLGFNVEPGGEHTDRITRNALIPFADGSYFELVAFNGPAPSDHFFYRPPGTEGIITFALLPDAPADDILAAQRRGLNIAGPIPGGRVRPDGQEITWQLGRASTSDVPFLCGDVTPRELRVPGGDATNHRNGVVGIAGITVVVASLNTAMQHYRALLGTDPLPYYTRLVSQAFQVGDAIITLVEPVEGPMREFLDRQGEGPYSVALRVAGGVGIAPLDPALTHGARIELVRGATIEETESEEE